MRPVSRALEQLPERDPEALEVAHQREHLLVGQLAALRRAVRDGGGEQQVDDDDGGEADRHDDAGVPVSVAGDVEAGEQEHPAERQRDEDLPAEVHELVVAEPRAAWRAATRT